VEDNSNSKGIVVTQDEIIKMARQAGCPMANMMPMYFTDTQLLVMLEAFAKLVAEKERNACAKIADEWAVGWPHPSQSIAEWIRKRT
jgi:sugar phosphate isomerase/epimerase